MLTLEEMRRCLSEQHAQRRRLYAEFLRSPEWRAAAARVRERFHYLCLVCRTCENTQVHHLRYDLPNRPEAEGKWPAGWLPVADAGLVLLCADCHEIYHRYRRM